jgi:antitoxin (DNA-binding transcriptional repressor) of toxin-antitoxin stability system
MTHLSANLHEVKKHLSLYARKVKAGQSIIVCERNRPIAELRPFGKRIGTPRKLGCMKGSVTYNGEFSAADAEITATFTETNLLSDRES